MNPLDAFEGRRITVPDSVLVRELEGESVLLNLDNDQYYGLNDVGTRMVALFAETGSAAAVHRQLLEEFAVEPQRLADDMAALVGELVGQGLLAVQPA